MKPSANEGKIRNGNILISVHTDSSRNADKAKAVSKMLVLKILPQPVKLRPSQR